jgi:hypothetical protein
VNDNTDHKNRSCPGTTSYPGKAPLPSVPEWKVDVTPPDWSGYRLIRNVKVPSSIPGIGIRTQQ